VIETASPRPTSLKCEYLPGRSTNNGGSTKGFPYYLSQAIGLQSNFITPPKGLNFFQVLLGISRARYHAWSHHCFQWVLEPEGSKASGESAMMEQSHTGSRNISHFLTMKVAGQH
jgi:hypothetical protein